MKGQGSNPQERDTPRLDDGSPLYYVFVPQASLDEGFIRPNEAQKAQALLRKCLDINPGAVEACLGKTYEHPRVALYPLLWL